MAAWCRIELLGGLRVIWDERSIVRFRTQKTAALLAFLAYHCDRAHPREALIEMLWPWANLDAGRQSLSQALYSLRHQLEPPGVPAGTVLVADRSNVQLNPQAMTTDLLEFEGALHAAERASDKAAKERELEEAVRLYRGELLPGLYEPWIPAEQVRLSERFVSAVVLLAKLLAERGEVAAAISHLRQAIETEPLQEEPYRELMRRLMERGEHGAALKAYHELEHVFADELGERPSGTTRQLAREVERLAGEQPGSARVVATATQPTIRRRRPTKLPSGVVTVLLVRADRDVGGAGEPYTDRSLYEEFRRHGGVEIEPQRSAIVAAFGHAGDALNCAAVCQLQATRSNATDSEPTVRLTMAIHTAELAVGPDGAYPPGSFQRAERLLDAAHPTQILCSEASAGLLRYGLNGGLRLRDLGVYRLRGASASERVFQLEYTGSADTLPALNAESGYTSHLPLRLTRFFGRRRESEQLRAMLTGNARLVTVIGPPGCGKTRLAIEVAAGLQEHFHGAVWFVPLADLREGRAILDRVLDPLGISRAPQATPLDQIAATLGEERVLLVFDNFEHMVEQAAEVRNLLERLPMLRCLVTSRRRLGLSGEREFPLPPLSAPEGLAPLPDLLCNESVELFVDRAQAVMPDFQLTAGNAEAVVEICRRLEGVPLAIELAAAATNALGLAQILERIAKGEDLLSRSRDADARHRSLRAAVEWSYELLTPELQRFFARLSAFRGGWTVEAAEAVCDDPLVLDHLAALAECSLIQVEQSPLGARFRMLEVLREYAHDRLADSGEEAASRQRHLNYFMEFGTNAHAGMRGTDVKEWFDRVGAESENIFAAHEWCDSTPSGATAGVRIITRFAMFWQTRDPGLGLAIAERALRRSKGERTEARAHALNAAGGLMNRTGDTTRARVAFTESLSIFEELNDKRMTAAVLNNLAIQECRQRQYDLARNHYDRALALNRELGNQAWIGTNLDNLANLESHLGNFETARSLHEESLKIYRDVGARAAEGTALGNLGHLLTQLGDLESARTVLMESLIIHREQGSVLVFPLNALAEVDMKSGQFESARSWLLEGFHRVRAHGEQQWIGSLLKLTAYLAIAVTDAAPGRDTQSTGKQAACLLAALQPLAEPARAPAPCDRAEMDRTKERLSGMLGGECFRACWEEGRTIPLEQAVDRAVALLESLDIPRDQAPSESQTA